MGRVRDSLLSLFGYPTKPRPEQAMDSMIATMSVRLRKCKGQVAIVLASQKRLQEQLHQNMNMVTQYQVKALAAVGRGEDELARELLRKKKRYEDTVDTLKGQLLKHKRTSDSLMELVRRLELKLEETKRNKLLLLTQKECYETSQIIEDGFTGDEDEQLGFRDILEGLEDDVNSLRYTTQVGVDIESEQLDHEDEPLALPDESDVLEEHDPRAAIEDELDSLREKLNANPALLEEAEEAQVLHLIESGEEEDDEPEPDDDEDDDEEVGIQILSTDGVSSARPAAPRAAARAVAPAAVEDDDDEYEDDEYEEEEEEPPPPPPPKKKRRRRKAAAAAEPAPEPDDDDEDDGILFIT